MHIRERGFTLIELMVVLVILGVLAALIAPKLMDRPDEARVIAAKQDIGAISQALKLYRLDNMRAAGAFGTREALGPLRRALERPEPSGPTDWRTFEALDLRLTAARADLDRRFSDLAMLRDEALSVRADLNEAVAARVALIADIDRRRDLNAQLVGELRQTQDSLEQVLSAPPAGGDPRAEGAAKVALPLGAFKGEIDWPVAGGITLSFGPHVNPRFGTTTLSTGIEIAAAEGAAAAAVHDGTVAFAEAFAGFGLLVILDHGRQSHSLYGHLGAIGVSRGAHVAKGQAVGTVGRGPLGKPSLYFELRVDGQPVDPVQWLKAR